MAACRDAELLYRSGLGVLALGPEGLTKVRHTSRGKMGDHIYPADACLLIPLEDNRRAATLLLNLAQTLLNQDVSSELATAAAAEAVAVSSGHQRPQNNMAGVL